MQILRVSPSYSSQESPGSGLNAYSHTVNSRVESYVLTEYSDKTLFDSPNSTIKKLQVPKFKLLHNSHFFFFSLLLKAIQIFIFLLKSIGFAPKY